MKGIGGAAPTGDSSRVLSPRHRRGRLAVIPLVACLLAGMLVGGPKHVRAYTSSGPEVVSGGTAHGLAVRTDGSVWAWGNNYFSQLGTGASDPSPSPVQMSGVPASVAVAAGQFDSYALDSSGNVWAWGDNYYGELGQGQAATSGCYCSATPVQVPGLFGVTAIAAGSGFALALEGNGTVWAWGYNEEGELGLGFASIPTSSTDCGCVAAPAAVPGLSGITSIAVAMYHSLALKSDGTV